MSDLLTLHEVSLALGGSEVLRQASLCVRSGEHALVLGPSGSGKTTLLNVASGLLSPERGEVQFRERPLSAYGSPARFRREQIGFVFQDLHLLETLTVAQNIALVQAAMGAPSDAPSPSSLLGPLGMEAHLNRRVSVLSRGERQRVALARAFANRPSLILADEPTSSLDPGSREQTLSHLWTLCEQTGATALVVSHDEALRDDARFTARWLLSAGAPAPLEPVTL
ncbi:MAG: ABC transporter ATP-binding protein [Myxococcota bacterium]